MTQVARNLAKLTAKMQNCSRFSTKIFSHSLHNFQNKFVE